MKSFSRASHVVTRIAVVVAFGLLPCMAWAETQTPTETLVPATATPTEALVPDTTTPSETLVPATATPTETACVAPVNDAVWSERAPMNVPRLLSGVGELDGKVYVVGGFRALDQASSGYISKEYYDTVEAYDPVCDTWSTMASLSGPRGELTCQVLDGKLYAIGGRTSNYTASHTGRVEVYDQASDSWSMLANMPTARFEPTSAALNGRIYVLGGQRDGFFSTVEVYDPQTNTWSSAPSMPQALSGAAAVAYQGEIYVFGGRDHGGEKPAAYAYNPETEAWRSLASMPTPRYRLSAVVLGDEILVIGGRQTTSPWLDVVEVYDPQSNSWGVRAPLPYARDVSHLPAVWNHEGQDQVVVVGGWTIWHGNTVGGITMVTHVYDPRLQPPTHTPTDTPPPTNTWTPTATPTTTPTRTPTFTASPPPTDTPPPRVIYLEEGMEVGYQGSVTVRVRVSDGSDVVGVRVGVQWDADLFQFRAGSAVAPSGCLVQATPHADGMLFSLACTQEYVAGDVELFTFVLDNVQALPCDEAVAYPLTLDPELTRINDGALHSATLDGEVVCLHTRALYFGRNIYVSAGDTVSVPVLLDDAHGVIGARFSVQWATEAFRYVPNSALARPGCLVAEFVDGDRVTFSVACLDEYTGFEQIVLRLSLESLADAECEDPGVEYPLNFVPGSVRLNDGAIRVAALDGIVLCGPSMQFLWGDLNNDGVAGTLDASLILQWDAFRIVEFPGYPGVIWPDFPPAGDVSGDGVLGTLDAAQLLQYDALIRACFSADTNCDGLGPDTP